MSLAGKSLLDDLDAIDDLDAPGRSPARGRQRRGGPRMPFVVLLTIAVLCGIGVAYVSQTAHVTEATYEAVSLAQQQQQLQAQADDLHAQLARLQASSRIISAATRLGMRPPGTWAYASAAPDSLAPASPPSSAGSQSAAAGPLQRIMSALIHLFVS